MFIIKVLNHIHMHVHDILLDFTRILYDIFKSQIFDYNYFIIKFFD